MYKGIVVMLRVILLLALSILSTQAWSYVTSPIYHHDVNECYCIDRNIQSESQNYQSDGKLNSFKTVECLQADSIGKRTLNGIFFAFLDDFVVTKGAGNIAAAPKLASELRLQSARSPFKANGTLTNDAIRGADEIIPASKIADPNIPSGFSKFSSQTFQSPSGDFQVRFLKNPRTGEALFDNPNFKTIFNRISGQK